MKTTNYLTVIAALGEALEKNELTITCQQYEINELKEKIIELNEKVNRIKKGELYETK